MLLITALLFVCVFYILHNRKTPSQPITSLFHHAHTITPTISIILLDIPTTQPLPPQHPSRYTAYGISPHTVLDHRTASVYAPSIFVKLCAASCYNFSNTRGPEIARWLASSQPPSDFHPNALIHFVLVKPHPNTSPKIIAFLH